ncbi:MAG: hypothetical protein AAB552_01955 [Patescibacteria group bacterium]
MSLLYTWFLKRVENVLIVGAVVFAFALIATSFSVVHAQEGGGIIFPIAELGNCTDKASCKSFCDKTENLTVCVKFAEDHKLISKENAQKAKKLAEIGTGPGGCTGRACETYCEDAVHIDECVAFAEKHNIAPPDELKEMKQVVKALKGGAKLPGGCKGKESCQTYCADTGHADECLAFAEKAGFMKKEELEHARKVLPLMARGETPGGCKSREQCEAYCESGDHTAECLAFAEKAGFMSSKELEMAKKTGGKGPGGCVGRACQNFCNNPANQDVCVSFAREHGLIDEQQVQDIQEGAGRMRMGLEHAPAEVKACLKEALGEDVLNNIEAGALTPSADVGKRAHECFEKFMPQGGESGGMREMNRPRGDEQGTTSERVLNQRPSALQEMPEEVRVCLEGKRAELEAEVKRGEVISREEVERSMRECIPQNMMQRGQGDMPQRDPRAGFSPPEPAPHSIPGRPMMQGRRTEGGGYPMGSGTVPSNRGNMMQGSEGRVYPMGSGTPPFDGRRPMMQEGEGRAGETFNMQSMPPRDPRTPEGEHMQGTYPVDRGSQFTPQEQGFQGGAGMMEGRVPEPFHTDTGGYVAPPLVQ